LDAHGHHGPYGPAACGPTWREDPRLLVQLAARMAEASGPPTAVSAREAASAEPGLMPPWPRRGVASLLLHHVRRGLRLRLALEEDLARATSLLRELALEAGRRLRRAGVVGASEDALLLPVGDLALLVPLRLEWPSARRLRLLERHRRRRRAYVSRPDPPPAFVARGRERIPSHAGESWPLHGLAAAPGSATARVRVLRNPEDLAEMRPGEILVCRALPPGLAPFLRLSAGLVMETGTALSTAAALAREYRLPAVVGLLDATLRLRTGDLLRLDGLHGVVERLDS
jgi:pyruvate,water dikinase